MARRGNQHVNKCCRTVSATTQLCKSFATLERQSTDKVSGPRVHPSKEMFSGQEKEMTVPQREETLTMEMVQKERGGLRLESWLRTGVRNQLSSGTSRITFSVFRSSDFSLQPVENDT